MANRRKPETDDEIIEAIIANDGSISAASKSKNRGLVTFIKRLKKQPLRSRYRALVLVGVGGNMTLAADALGLSRRHLYDLIEEDGKKFDPVVAAGWAEGCERRLDFAESKLDENINAGKEASIFFFLKCRGKHRGYIERQEISGPDGVPISDVRITVTHVKPSDSN